MPTSQGSVPHNHHITAQTTINNRVSITLNILSTIKHDLNFVMVLDNWAIYIKVNK